MSGSLLRSAPFVLKLESSLPVSIGLSPGILAVFLSLIDFVLILVIGGDKMNKPAPALIIQAVIDAILAIGTALIAIFK